MENEIFQEEFALTKDWTGNTSIYDIIGVKPCTQEHVEQYLKSPMVYAMEKPCHGRCLILLNERFKSFPERTGTDKDAKRIKKLFEQLQFEVIIHWDLTAEEIQSVLSEEAKHSDHYEAECFVCVICSHGSENGIYGVDGNILSLNEITTYFDGNNCIGLKSKPKLFFIQSSRAWQQYDALSLRGRQYVSKPLQGIDAARHLQHAKADILVVNAACPGGVSFRNALCGSWFIQAVVYVFRKYACEEDIFGLLTLVNNLISRRHYLDRSGSNRYFQVSCHEGSFTKKFFFFPMHKMGQEHGKANHLPELPEVWPNKEIMATVINVEPCSSELVKKYHRRSHVYPMTKSCRGRCLILSNEIFYNPKKFPNRQGTEKDVERLEKLFTQLHFKCITIRDLEAKEIRRELSKEANNSDHAEAECFICVICSHGCKRGIYGVDGDEKDVVSVKDITTCFDGKNCTNLKSKPKLFFIQACRTESEQSKPNEDGPDLTNLIEETNETDDISHCLQDQKQVESQLDVLVACATHSGYVSFRNNLYGSWFIQAVIYVFQKQAYKEDIVGLLTLVNELVARGRTNSDGSQNVMQASKYKTSLRKKLFFFPGSVSNSDS